ncbi:MAG: cell division protein ZapA [Treponemataceae bacterium]|nr:cell division protein ZapA [Treponemataceae bacterium]
MGILQIDILGTSFAIQAKEDSIYMQTLLSHYKQVADKIEQTTGLTDPLKQAILAGIFITDELYKEKQEQNKQETVSVQNNQDLQQAEQVALQMISQLNQIIT